MIRWPMYSGPYERRFRRAARATRRLGYAPHAVPYVAPLLVNGKVAVALRDALAQLKPQQIAHMCVVVSQIAKRTLVPVLGCDATLTFGFVELQGTRIYEFTASQLRPLLTARAETPRSLSLHAWLTLPSMEVIDASLPTTWMLGAGKVLPPERLPFIARHADHLENGMTYHPVVTGEDLAAALAGGWTTL